MDQSTVASNRRTDDQQINELLIRDRSFIFNRINWIGKRSIDIIMSFISIIGLCPFMILLAIIIFIDDPMGSPIFVQQRCGRHGRLFKLYKFRSMCVNAENELTELIDMNEMSGPVFKIKNDPRITRVGRFIRTTSIDELPQLFNVLMGDMSLVGPRPPLPNEVKQYNSYQSQRLFVTPGLTCYWQVSPQRNTLSFDEWVELDIKYMNERSLWLDFKLVIMTIKVMALGQGQ
jgi:lipopolysaccharide/colanic/teichoic acid biosynthesis glycosyltransferase